MELHNALIETKIIPKFIKTKVPDANLKSFDIKSLGGGTFMLTICYQVHIVVVYGNGGLENFYLFTKITPECGAEIYDLVQFHNLFTNEINAYTQILPIFDLHKKYVKLHDSDVQRSSSYLVLDDFTKRGWRLAREKVNLSLGHIIAAMHELAVFHGKFYALKIQSTNKFMDVVDLFRESRYHNDLPESYHQALKAECLSAVNCVRNRPPIYQQYIFRLNNLIGKNMDLQKVLIESKIIPKFIEHKAPNSKLKSFDIKLLSGETFMLTVCYQVHIVVVKPDSELHNFWLFVKITPECQPEMYELVRFDNLFTNEINAYTHIIPIIDVRKKYVKLRDSKVERSSTYLVLDDFTKRGWRLTNEKFNLSLEHIFAAMHELAVFHGRIYALKIQSKDKFSDIVGLFQESRYINDLAKSYNDSMVYGCKHVINCVRNSDLKDEIPEEFLQKLSHLLEDPHNYGRQIVRPKEPLSTLCHGDYLRNNIAFRYTLDADGNEIPAEAMMFDLQTIRHSSPMVDVCVFICNSTGIDVRGPNFDKIFDSYFDTLVETIKQDLTVDLPEYFNRRRFLQEYVKFLPLGLSIAAYFLPVLSNKDELVLDLTDPMGPEKMAEQMMELGGENVDREYRSIIHQMYTLSKELNVDIFSI